VTVVAIEQSRLARVLAPFSTTIPDAIRGPLTLLQFERLNALTPLLYFTIAANAFAMTLAVLGDLPLWQQLTPPVIIISVCLWQVVMWHQRRRQTMTPERAYRLLQKAVVLAGGIGLTSGLWTVSAFSETEKYFCLVAPVFLAITALVSANCLTSVPRAATVAMVTALSPIVVRLLVYDNLGMRSIAVMLVLIAALQSRLVQLKFRETEKMLILQHEIVELSEADPLTGLKNRRAFTALLQAELDGGQSVIVAMLDLDGFKLANDNYGHHAGDDVLISVAGRMQQAAVSALCVARLGGDEFALIFGGGVSAGQAQTEVEAIRAMIALPHPSGEAMIMISASAGIANSSDTGGTLSALLQAADRALYAEKAERAGKAERRRSRISGARTAQTL
jgi:diguanylate cyclase (GGDEF)-like protein